MSASSADLNPATQVVDLIPCPLAASTLIYQYENVATDASGNLNPVSDTSGLVFQGYSANHSDNSGGIAGAVVGYFNPIGNGNAERFYVLDCAGATQAWVGSLAEFTDDHTVALSSSHSILAGMVVQFLSATQVVVDTMRRTL
jgi:hypothetical protein